MLRKIVKFFIPSGLFKAVEPYGHLAEAVFMNALMGFPARGLKIIGVTGTNGKTTTSFMIHRMLVSAGYKTGLMTTVAYGAGENLHPQVEHMTTVSVPLLLRRIKQLRGEGIEWLVLETTSHALAQNRVWGIPYSIAVMTNVTHEHLDYHGTYEKYLAAKVKLFRLTASNKGGLRTGIVNADDPHAKDFISVVPRAVTYGLGQADVRAASYRSDAHGSHIQVSTARGSYGLDCHMPGSFNISNALAAVAVGEVIGLSHDQIAAGIEKLEGVEGRMDTIEAGQDFGVIIDFAHTPDSFEKLLPAVKKVTQGRLIVLFGSAGRRDEAKRGVQGALAGEYADIIVVSEEDDRDVDGVEIMNQIAAGAEQAGKTRDKDLFLIHDRTQAIGYALSLAQKGDTVLLLGKGHEKTIERADGVHPWNEAEVVKSALTQLKR